MKELDYKRMIQEIADLTQSDFLFDMDCKAIHPEQPFSHEESTKMRDILINIYSIAHCNTCSACQTKYILTTKSSTSKR